MSDVAQIRAAHYPVAQPEYSSFASPSCACGKHPCEIAFLLHEIERLEGENDRLDRMNIMLVAEKEGDMAIRREMQVKLAQAETRVEEMDRIAATPCPTCRLNIEETKAMTARLSACEEALKHISAVIETSEDQTDWMWIKDRADKALAQEWEA